MSQAVQTHTATSRPITLIRGAANLARRLDCGRTRIYVLMADASFPKPIRLIGNQCAWYEHEVEEWLASRPRVDIATDIGARLTEARKRKRAVTENTNAPAVEAEASISAQ